MQEIIKKLNEVVSIAESRVQKADQERSAYAGKKADSDALLTKLKEAEKALSAREAAVKDLEDVKNAREEKARIDTEIKEAYRLLNADQEKLSKEKEQFEADVKDQSATLEMRKKKLNDAQAALDEDKRSYKQKIIADVTANVRKSQLQG